MPQILPAFADQDSKALSTAIEALTTQLKATAQDCDAQTQRGDAMLDYLRHLRIELASSQNRLDARSKELASERHLAQLNKHETVNAALLCNIFFYSLSAASL